MLLLDTHVLIWMVEADDRLGRRGRTAVDDARVSGGAMVSPISAWEAAMLERKGKLGLGKPIAMWFEAVLATPGFVLAELTVAIGADAGSLPGDIHGDPADRLIVATARALGCSLLTADRKIIAYAAAGHVQAIDARR